MIEINLLPAELRVKAKAKKTAINLAPNNLKYLIPVILGVLILVHFYVMILSLGKSSQYRKLNEKWVKLEPQKKTLESYNSENASLSESAKAVQKFVDLRINWSEKLNKLSIYLPSGIWFNELHASAKELVLRASVITLQNNEMELIAKLIEGLKKDAGFFKGFTSLELGSVQHRSIGSYDIAEFTLTASFKSK